MDEGRICVFLAYNTVVFVDKTKWCPIEKRET